MCMYTHTSLYPLSYPPIHPAHSSIRSPMYPLIYILDTCFCFPFTCASIVQSGRPAILPSAHPFIHSSIIHLATPLSSHFLIYPSAHPSFIYSSAHLSILSSIHLSTYPTQPPPLCLSILPSSLLPISRHSHLPLGIPWIMQTAFLPPLRDPDSAGSRGSCLCAPPSTHKMLLQLAQQPHGMILGHPFRLPHPTVSAQWLLGIRRLLS